MTAVGKRQHAVFPHVLSHYDRHSCHGAHGNRLKKKAQQGRAMEATLLSRDTGTIHGWKGSIKVLEQKMSGACGRMHNNVCFNSKATNFLCHCVINRLITYFEHTNVKVMVTIEGYKDQHTLKWQTKEGTYRIKAPDTQVDNVVDQQEDVIMADL